MRWIFPQLRRRVFLELASQRLGAVALASLLNQHDAFIFEFQGLDAKLTGVEGAKVIKDILV